jgi:hypothetical protein
MTYVSYIYYGTLAVCLVYFILYLASIIRNFAKVLQIKVLSINPVPSTKDIETPLENETQNQDQDKSISKAETDKASNEIKSVIEVVKITSRKWKQRRTRKKKEFNLIFDAIQTLFILFDFPFYF